MSAQEMDGRRRLGKGSLNKGKVETRDIVVMTRKVGKGFRGSHRSQAGEETLTIWGWVNQR